MWLWFSGRQKSQHSRFHRCSTLIKHSEYILNRVASLAGFTNEHPNPSCFGSLLKQSSSVFFVAHGGRVYQDNPYFTLNLPRIS